MMRLRKFPLPLQSMKGKLYTSLSSSSSLTTIKATSSILQYSFRSLSTTTTPTTPPSSSSSSSSSDTNSSTTSTTSDKKDEQLAIRKIMQEDDDYNDDDYNSSGQSKGGYKKFFSYFLFGTISSIVLYAGYSIFMELFGRSAPNNLFNETFDLVRVSDEVMRMTGDPMRAYGMDTGRHTEGRRNFVASR